ncbi:MAG: hypothetical protein KA764_13070 [Anaerolineales bacterium]|nr:hypothetical protein [Anaerolineales bacterium]
MTTEVQMNIIVTGASRNADTGIQSVAVSLAAMFGLLAGRRTLLVDLSLEPDRSRQPMNLTPGADLSSLLARFLVDQRLDSDTVARQVAVVDLPASHPLAGRQFDVLANPPAASPEYADDLSTQRGTAFVQALYEQIVQLDYEIVIVDFGQTLDTLRGAALAGRADLVVLVGRRDAPETQVFIRNRLQSPHFAVSPERLLLVAPGDYAFPHPEFLDSLTRHEQRYENAAVRTALELAELLEPGISKHLTDATGRPIRPAQLGLWRRLFG